jgi:enamine deaminase RidA (YjgF/YER057c/UK114 family)
MPKVDEFEYSFDNVAKIVDKFIDALALDKYSIYLKVSDRSVSRIEGKLSALGESLPEAKKPVANYLGCKRSGNTLYVSGRVSQIRGEVGTDLNVAKAQMAAKGALLDILAIIKDEIGNLDKVVSVEKLVGFVRSAPSFTEQPEVIDGASDLLIALDARTPQFAR